MHAMKKPLQHQIEYLFSPSAFFLFYKNKEMRTGSSRSRGANSAVDQIVVTRLAPSSVRYFLQSILNR
jgi:hypothetical protein